MTEGLALTEPTLLAALTAAVLRAAREAGADGDALLAAASMNEAELADPDGRISVQRHLRLIRALSALPTPMGLELGSRLGVEGLGVVGYAMQHDATLGSALAWLERYRAVVLDDVVARMEEGSVGGRASIAFCHLVPPTLVELREPAEIWAAAQLSTLRRLTGQELAPWEVHLPHRAPANTDRHEAFFRSPIRWEASRIELHFDPAVLDLPLARAHPELFRYLERRAEALRDELPPSSIRARVRQALERSLANGEPRVEMVAHELSMSARTLQRRLAEEGTTFAGLLDEVRRERAELLLRDPRLAVSEVAFVLGYSEPAAFFRSFRRWTGTTPKAFRAKGVNDP